MTTVQLANTIMAMADMIKANSELVERLVDMQKPKEEKKLVGVEADDELWRVQIARHLGKGFPEKLALPLSKESLLDPVISCEPTLLLLIFLKTELEDWVEDSVLPGPMLKRWLGLSSRDAVWLPRRASHSDGVFLRETLIRLQDSLLVFALAFYRHPNNIGPATWFLEQSTLISACEDLCKELEGRVIRIRSGSVAAAEFYAAHRLLNRKTGASLAIAASKIRVRGGQGASATVGDQNAEEIDQLEEDEERHQSNQGKWTKKKLRNQRRNNKLDKDGKDRTRDPTPADPRRCNKCRKDVTVSWAAHKAASPGC